MNNDKYVKRIAINGLMLALAIIMSFVESLIPFNFGIPGIKLGLANLVILFMLWHKDYNSALIVNVLRVLIIAILFGNANSFAFSIAGAVFSFVVMYIMHKYTAIHTIVISMLGALAHVLGQLVVGLIWYPVGVIIYYSVFLLVSAFITGILLGIIADRINELWRRFGIDELG